MAKKAETKDCTMDKKSEAKMMGSGMMKQGMMDKKSESKMMDKKSEAKMMGAEKSSGKAAPWTPPWSTAAQDVLAATMKIRKTKGMKK